MQYFFIIKDPMSGTKIRYTAIGEKDKRERKLDISINWEDRI